MLIDGLSSKNWELSGLFRDQALQFGGHSGGERGHSAKL